MLTIFILAFAPGLFWLWFFYQKDRLDPEPKKLILKAFILGMVAVFPAALLETPFIGTGSFLAVVFAPIIEEVIKFLIVKRFFFDDREFNEPMDGIIYAAAVALGFASLENVGYLLIAFETDSLMTAFVTRALLSVPGHVLFSAMWGYALGLAKYFPSFRKRGPIYRGLALSIVLHGLFNLFTHIRAAFAVIMIIFILIMWRMVNRRIAIAFKISKHVKREISSHI